MGQARETHCVSVHPVVGDLGDWNRAVSWSMGLDGRRRMHTYIKGWDYNNGLGGNLVGHVHRMDDPLDNRLGMEDSTICLHTVER